MIYIPPSLCYKGHQITTGMASVYKQFSLVILLLIQTVTSDRKFYSKIPLFVQDLTKVLHQIDIQYPLSSKLTFDKRLKVPDRYVGSYLNLVGQVIVCFISNSLFRSSQGLVWFFPNSNSATEMQANLWVYIAFNKCLNWKQQRIEIVGTELCIGISTVRAPL